MSTLHSAFKTELDLLAATQPAQPADRLAAVTGRARSIRRRRAAASGLAVVALGLVGAGVVQASRPTPVRYTATPVTQWPDRSEADGKDLGFSAFSSWYGDSTEDAHLRWLYRGVVTPPGGQAVVVADFIATKDYVTWLMQMHIERNRLDDNGNLLDPTDQWVHDNELDLATVKTPPGYLDNVVSTSSGTAITVLDAPSARHLGWRYTPLPAAPATTTPTSGTVRSDDGVFTVVLGPVTGPVTVTDPAGHAHVHTDIALMAPEDFPVGSEQFSSGGTGTTTAGERSTWNAAGEIDADPITGKRSVDVRCYGGGTMTATIRVVDKANLPGRVLATGSAPCDGAAHRAISSARIDHTGIEVDFHGDRLQAYATRIAFG